MGNLINVIKKSNELCDELTGENEKKWVRLSVRKKPEL